MLKVPLLSYLLLVVAGTLREANTGSPIRQTDPRGARSLGLPGRPRKSSIWRPCDCGAGPLQYPHGDQRSGASFLFLGIYYHETHKTSAKTARNIRATNPRKTPKTTASSLRFGLNVEPKESFASSGRSGS